MLLGLKRVKEQTFFSLVTRYYGLSLLRTLNLPPEGVRNNGSRLYFAFWKLYLKHLIKCGQDYIKQLK